MNSKFFREEFANFYYHRKESKGWSMGGGEEIKNDIHNSLGDKNWKPNMQELMLIPVEIIY